MEFMVFMAIIVIVIVTIIISVLVPSYESFTRASFPRFGLPYSYLPGINMWPSKVTHYRITALPHYAQYASATFLGSSRPSYISAPIRADPCSLDWDPPIHFCAVSAVVYRVQIRL
ncbi:hypothetical protein F5Y06DRAFT_297062 [Hypoxylon sp. FL0890]|nr:hypothetical protein F5Y06DRAFT_297062 [Hypoxylon sp. FL0890]